MIEKQLKTELIRSKLGVLEDKISTLLAEAKK